MDAVWIDVPEDFLDERRRHGQDKKDELWEGVLHMVPPPSPKHNLLSVSLYNAFRVIASRRGLNDYQAHDDAKRIPARLVDLADRILQVIDGKFVGSMTGDAPWIIITELPPDAMPYL